jgi:hypothetical protein
MSQDKELLTPSELKGRGWNGRLIALLLGEPDERKRNPYYKAGPPMKLYKVARVLEAENSNEFRQQERRSPKQS